MDIVLDYFDEYVGDYLYSGIDSTAGELLRTSGPMQSLLSNLSLNPPRTHIVRQALSLYGITYVSIVFLYFITASLSYHFIFDKRMEQHPRFLPNQVHKEIMFSLEAFPLLDLFTLPWFVGDVRGHSLLYVSLADGPFGDQARYHWSLPYLYVLFSILLFLVVTDFGIYWIHRWLHIPWLYKRLHKPHHKWIIPTPFASHAFHPIDGYLQSVPYHLCCYIMPLHRVVFLGLFTFVNFWSIFIHDSDMLSNTGFEWIINGPAHHTLHHIYFTCNYGQYFTTFDKLGGSFREPAAKDDPLLDIVRAKERRESEKREFERRELGEQEKSE